MKWKDNLIYEFINQIISFKWILKPETLWWLNRREKVFSLPCVKRIVFLQSGFGRDGGTRVCNPRTQRLGCTLSPGHGERIAPSLAVKLKCSELSTLTDLISFLVTPLVTSKELPVLSLEMQTEEQVCEYLDWTQGFRSKTSRPSSQAGLQAPSTSVLEVRRVACRSGVFFLFTLKALSGVRTVRSQVQLRHGGCQRHGGSPVGASLRGLICAVPFCSSHHGDESAEDQSPESGLILVIC